MLHTAKAQLQSERITMAFDLHPQLAADTLLVGELQLSRLLLTNDNRFPWLILVPRAEDARDLIDLSRDDQVTLLDEIDTTSRALKRLTKSDKLNVAALGNMVPQLHIHVVARHTTDAAWPGPIWGVGTPVPYSCEAAEEQVERIRSELAISA